VDYNRLPCRPTCYSTPVVIMKKILIIEDDDDILEVVSFVLTDNGFETVNHKQIITLNQVIKIAPHLILLDHFLGDGLGDGFCLELKKHPGTKHLPVVLFSAAFGLASITKLNCADAYIQKPFDMDDLLRTVNQHIL
jgi:DNA-binding response OmpR family regulator